ncbi:hypothetical protein G7046_g10153 [Stylonectria norvegica]|nr:hypothetical protein G7046_g10153 [Stylonectria norvegica]
MRPFARSLGRKPPVGAVVPRVGSQSHSTTATRRSISPAAGQPQRKKPRYRDMAPEGSNYQSWSRTGLIQRVKELEKELRNRPTAPTPGTAPGSSPASASALAPAPEDSTSAPASVPELPLVTESGHVPFPSPAPAPALALAPALPTQETALPLDSTLIQKPTPAPTAPPALDPVTGKPLPQKNGFPQGRSLQVQHSLHRPQARLPRKELWRLRVPAHGQRVVH